MGAFFGLASSSGFFTLFQFALSIFQLIFSNPDVEQELPPLALQISVVALVAQTFVELVGLVSQTGQGVVQATDLRL